MSEIKVNFFLFLYAFILVFFSGCGFAPNNKPGIFINEFLSSNNGINVEPLNYEYEDWIEIYNGYDIPFNLSNYYLTDDPTDSTKWKFPKGTKIPAKSFIIVWADRQDTLLHTNFKLSKDGGHIAIYSKENILLDRVDYKTQVYNVSSGRQWDGAEQWVYYEDATPAFSNNSQKGFENLEFSSEPTFSLEAGFYNNAQKLILSSPIEGAKIRYTLNGNTPTRKSRLYKEPITIDSTSIIRAISIEDEKLSSKPITRTYFINVDKYLPIISLVSDSVALWDTVSGIYQKSLRNVKRIANLEFFEDQDHILNQTVNMYINGNVARFHGQKAILLEADSKYGKATIDHRFFPDKRVYSFHSILLRAGGHPDKYNTMFRDGMSQYLTEEHLDIDYLAYRPVVTYLNGKYWGIYNIREKLKSNFFVDNYNLDKNQFDLLKTAWATEDNGDSKHYRHTLKFIKECDKTKPYNYEYVKTLIDVDNYIDYNICELYVANLDWPSWNIKFWREKKEGGLWKWILIDLDYGFGLGADVDSNMIAYATSPVKTRVTNPPIATELFRMMLEFPEFKQEFIQRFATSLNVIYSSKRVLEIINKFEDQRLNEMPHHIKRWKNSVYKSPWGRHKIPNSVVNWDSKIEVMKDFAKRRPDYVRGNLMEKFHIKGMVNIKTKSSGGHIAINTINLEEGNHEGSYFIGLPMKLEAIPNPGQKFLYWIVNGQINKSTLLDFTPNNNGNIEAIFYTDAQTELPCKINENMTLSSDNSPYYSTCDVVIDSGANLILEKGVEVLMSKHSSIIVYGSLICNGTKDQPVSIKPNPFTKTNEWGALCVENSSSPVELNYLNLLGGTWHDNKSKYKATITSLNSNITLDHVFIESSHFPFYSEYGTVSITNSKMTSPKTCDLINVKYATSALVENCELPGNNYPDTDAIDYDQIDNGIIRNNVIYGFFGFNSDAIDIGEASSKVLIEGNQIFNMSDKGVSVGQGSSVIIRNNLIYGCILGVGIKDKNSFAFIDQNTFFGNRYDIAVYEKNYNAGGGSAEVMNCIFYQSRKNPILVDSLSNIYIAYSLSDIKPIDGTGNIFGDPGFENPLNFNFKLRNTSLARNAGIENNNIGADIDVPRQDVPGIVINEINCSPIEEKSSLTWIELYNNSDSDIDVTGWTVKNDNHNIYALPQHLIIKKSHYIILTNNFNKFIWNYPDISMESVIEVLGKKAFSKGDALLLYDAKMNLVDYVNYKKMSSWPPEYNKTGASLKLKDPALENKHEENWIIEEYEKGTPGYGNTNN